MNPLISERSLESSNPEDLFIDIFSETFGIGKVQYLMHEYPFLDIYGMGRYIDYAIQTPLSRYAIEIDGIYYHAEPNQFESDLLKQNSLIYKNWKVYRWTDRQLNDREKVKDELVSFLGNEPQFLVADDYLPLQKAGVVHPRPHQEETLKYLSQLRKDNITIALVPHATGSGKTVTAILDARSLDLPTLYIAHTRNLVDQTYRKFKELWPEKRAGKFDAQQKDIESFILVSTIQSIEKNLEEYSKDQKKFWEDMKSNPYMKIFNGITKF